MPPKRGSPELTSIVPPTATAPGPSIERPWAFTPLTVRNSCAVSTSQPILTGHRVVPRGWPWSEPGNTAPGNGRDGHRLCPGCSPDARVAVACARAGRGASHSAIVGASATGKGVDHNSGKFTTPKPGPYPAF